MLPARRSPNGPMERGVHTPRKRHPVAHSISLVVILGCTTFSGPPGMAQDLRTAYQTDGFIFADHCPGARGWTQIWLVNHWRARRCFPTSKPGPAEE